MNLSPHFTLAELSVTEVRHLQATNRRAAEGFVTTLMILCSMLEKVRTLCGDRPVVIHSGFRSPELNKAIGGSKYSQHSKGEAADFHIAGLDLRRAFDLIRKADLSFGQLILEDGDGDGVPTWIHVSLSSERHSRQVLTFDGTDYHPVSP